MNMMICGGMSNNMESLGRVMECFKILGHRKPIKWWADD